MLKKKRQHPQFYTFCRNKPLLCREKKAMEQYRHTFCNVLQNNTQGEADEKIHLLGSQLPGDSVGQSTTVSDESGGGDNTLYKEITFPVQFRLYDYHQNTMLNQGTYNGPTGFWAQTDTKNNGNPSQGIDIDLLEYVQRGLHDVTASILSKKTQVKRSNSSSSLSSLQWVWTTNKDSQSYPCGHCSSQPYILPRVRSSKPSPDNISWSISGAPYGYFSQGFMVNYPHTQAIKETSSNNLFLVQRLLNECPYTKKNPFIALPKKIRWGSSDPEKAWSGKFKYPGSSDGSIAQFTAAASFDFSNVFTEKTIPFVYTYWYYLASPYPVKDSYRHQRKVEIQCIYPVNSKWWRIDAHYGKESSRWDYPFRYSPYVYINPTEQKIVLSKEKLNPKKATKPNKKHTGILSYESGGVVKKSRNHSPFYDYYAFA